MTYRILVCLGIPLAFACEGHHGDGQRIAGASAVICDELDLDTLAEVCLADTDDDADDDGVPDCADLDDDGDEIPDVDDLDDDNDCCPDHVDADLVMDDVDGLACEGEDEGAEADEIDLPYDIKMALGQTYQPILDAFAEEGPVPDVMVAVEMDGGGDWRLEELRTGAAFTITQADCDHQGNRDVGRDRVLVTWLALDGSSQTDHLDLRYCEE